MQNVAPESSIPESPHFFASSPRASGTDRDPIINPSLRKNFRLSCFSSVFMKLTSFFLLTILALQVAAQVQPQDEKQLYTLKYEKYRKTKTVGLIMTLAGALALGDAISKPPSSNSSNDLPTTLEIYAGEALLGGGIPLFVIGSKRMKQYRLKMEGITPDINVQRYSKYKRMQSAGIGMVVTGILFGAVGISKLQDLNGTYRYNRTDVEVGVLMVLGGAGLFGTGIPLTIRGTKKMKYYQQKIGNPSLSLGISSQRLTLSYRF